MKSESLLVWWFSTWTVAFGCTRCAVGPDQKEVTNPLAPIDRVVRHRKLGVSIGRPLEFHGRVHCLEARINSGDFVRGTATNPDTQKYRDGMDKSPGDEAGHLVAKRLGGTGKYTYNIVPMSKRLNVGQDWRTDVEDYMFQITQAGRRELEFIVEPQYQGDALRPHAIRYQICERKPNGIVTLKSAAVANPLGVPPTPSPALVAQQQVMSNWLTGVVQPQPQPQRPPGPLITDHFPPIKQVQPPPPQNNRRRA